MRRIGRLLASVAVATAALAGVDLLVHVELPIRLATGTSAVRASDLAGLLLADAEAGVLATGLAALLARVGRSAAPPLLATLVGGALLAVGVRERWSMAGWLVPAAVAWPIAAALAAVTARTLRRARASAAVAAAAPVLWVGLAATIGNVAIAHVAHGASLRGAVEGAAALGALGLLAWPPAWRRGATARVLCWSPALAALALAVVAAMPVPAPAPAGTPRRGGPPDLVLVVLDTVRADALSAYGNARPTSPNIDRLAAEGVRFSHAYSTTFWTLPSHASLLTGLHPSEHGATSETNHLPGAVTTLAETLRAEGYRTAAWVSNPWLEAERGFAQGFEQYGELWREALRGGTVALDREGVRRAIGFIEGRAPGSAPFFLFLNLNSAHLPYSPDPLRLVELAPAPRSPDRVARLRRVRGMWASLAGVADLDAEDFAILRDLYEAEVWMLDELVGKLVDVLRARGVLDETLVIVTADHGENLGEHGMIDHLLSLYETTTRVPLLMRHPPSIPAGRVDEALVSIVGVVPTVLDVVGVGSGDPAITARSLVRPERERDEFVVAENERPMLAMETMRLHFPDYDTAAIDSRMRMLRTRDHKLIWRESGPEELFDLRSDPGEEQNLAESHPELLRRLESGLQAWMAEHADAAPRVESGERAPFDSADPHALEELRALGYLE